MSYKLIMLIMGVLVGLLLWLKYHGYINLKLPKFRFKMPLMKKTSSNKEIENKTSSDSKKSGDFISSIFLFIILVIVVVVGFLFLKSRYFERKYDNEMKEIAQARISSSTANKVLKVRFPRSGKVLLKKNHPVEAYLNPNATSTICYLPHHSDEEMGTVYVSAIDTNMVFYDTVPLKYQNYRHDTPEYKQWKENHEAWLEFPAGECYVYLYGTHQAIFEWRTP